MEESFNPSEPNFLEFLLTVIPWMLIALWTVYSLLVILSKGFRSSFSNYYIIESIPNVFVTLGLLGTFTGITYGLLEFNTDPDLIKLSISTLLEGLKNALFTSIVGIILSLLFSKVIKIMTGQFIKEPDSPEYLQLVALNANFESFKETISDTHYKAIVDSFQEVLSNFNEVFTGFIGELVDKNFDKLTNSIDQLTQWQIEYKSDIETVKEAYESLVNKHEQFVQNTEKWVKTLEEISGQSSRLQKVVDEFNSAFNEDGDLSKILSKVKDSAADLQKVTSDFSELTTKMNETTDAISMTESKVTDWTEKTSKVSDTAGQIVAHLASIQNLELTKVNDLTGEFNKSLSRTFATFDSLVKAYIEEIENKRRRA